jgi:hypothetical protein
MEELINEIGYWILVAGCWIFSISELLTPFNKNK